jgi:hypothetical protein
MKKYLICLLMALGCAVASPRPTEAPEGGSSPSTATEAPAAPERTHGNLWLIRFHDYSRGGAGAGLVSDLQYVLRSRGYRNWRRAEELILGHLRRLYAGMPIKFGRERRYPESVIPKAGWLLKRDLATASLITLQWCPVPGLLGTAAQDPGNQHRENNSGIFTFRIGAEISSLYLGVMVNQVADASDQQWGRSFERICLTLALVLAHEIAHSVGVPHCKKGVPGDIMLPYHGKAEKYAFCEASKEVLRTNLNWDPIRTCGNEGVVQYSRLSLSRCGGGFLLDPLGSSAAPPATWTTRRSR